MGCGIAGGLAMDGNESSYLYKAIFGTIGNQINRGKKSTGYGWLNKKGIYCIKDSGPPSSVLAPDRLEGYDLSAIAGIGHNRYATFGSENPCDAHPTTSTKDGCRLDLVMNGEISMANELWRKELEQKGILFYGSTNDTSTITGLLLDKYLETRDVESALKDWYNQIFDYGGANVVGLLTDEELNNNYLLYSRDGLRPMFEADSSTDDERYRLFASEDTPLRMLPKTCNRISVYGVKEVPKGAIGFYDLSDMHKETFQMDRWKPTCVFEYLYMCAFTSTIDGKSVSDIRQELGRQLRKEHPPPKGASITYVPRSGMNAFEGYIWDGDEKPEQLQQLISKPDADRIFISGRSNEAVRQKAREAFDASPRTKGNYVVAIDDSIVKGNNSAAIVELLKQAGATGVEFGIAAPAIIGSCCAGVDTPEETLIALKIGLSQQEILDDHSKLERAYIENPPELWKKWKPDKVNHLSPEGLEKVCGKDVCAGCMNMRYHHMHPYMKPEKDYVFEPIEPKKD